MTIIEDSHVTIAHLGLIAGMIDTLGITDCIDSQIPQKWEHSVTHGEAIKALLINGLGYPGQRLFLMPEFFMDIATERLIRKGVRPDLLSSSLFRDCLDAVTAFSPTRLFSLIARTMGEKIPMEILRMQDHSLLFCAGDRESTWNTRFVRIVRGHPGDVSSDLRPFPISLVTDQRGVPGFMEMLPGNKPGTRTVVLTIEELLKNRVTGETHYHRIGPSLFSEDLVRQIGHKGFWIARVPEKVRGAREILNSRPEWIRSHDPRLTCAEFPCSYGGVAQKWVLYRNEDLFLRSLQAHRRNAEKKRKETEAAVQSLWECGFASEADARRAALEWQVLHPRYHVRDLILFEEPLPGSVTHGRPGTGDGGDSVWHVGFSLAENPVMVSGEQEFAGRFLLASNDPSIDPWDLLSLYEEERTLEKGFPFIKDECLFVSEELFEFENHMAALAMILVLCLMVDRMIEWQLRKALKEKNLSIRNQIRKPTQRPKSSWVYFLFRRVRQIDVMADGRRSTKILNYPDELKEIVQLLGPDAEKYYS